MLTGRFRVVRRLEDRHRKLLCVLNGQAKTKHEITNGNLTREKQYYDLQREKSVAVYRKIFMKKKALQKCMEITREDTFTSVNKNLYGHHGGRSVQAFTRQVDDVLETLNTKSKKVKRIQTLFEKGKETGLILEPETMSRKVKDYLHDKWGMQYKEQKASEAVDFFSKSNPIPNYTENLPPLFSFHKIVLKPLVRRENKETKEETHLMRRPDIVQEEDNSRSRRHRLKKLAEKAVCSKPKCEGYTGERIMEKTFMLPPIQNVTYLVQGAK